QCQPAIVNKIYYAHDDPRRSKSYNWGIPVKFGQKPPTNDLMIIQGIIGFRTDKNKKMKFAIEYSDLDFNNPPTEERVDFWVKNLIAINGQPNWRFIKLHTHAGREIRFDANFGESADRAFGYLERKYNDGKDYILHYVTACEMFNIIKAAEAGKEGNPSLYRDFEVCSYSYTV
ncbi:MAG: hypothetical protein J7L66_04185, partial [Anaerolineaceae bacterium]|nr:hypothetical protein [Anaerolineaceae bacterium]